MISSQVLQFANEQGYEGATYLCDWNGFKCYEPNFGADDIAYIGMPLLILEDSSGNLRMSTPDEALQQIKDTKKASSKNHSQSEP